MSDIVIADNNSRNSGSSIASAVSSLNHGEVSVYSSIKGDDFATKARVLAATTNAIPLSDHLGETIMLKDVVVQAIEVADEQSGEMQEAARIILLAEDGTSYAAVSGGIFKALTNMFGILGEPATWPHALPVQIVEEKGRKGFKYFTVKLVDADAPAAKK